MKEKLEEGLQRKRCFAEALASVFASLKVKHLCAHLISRISLNFLLMIKTACSFTVCQEKWHEGGGKLVTQIFAAGTWGEMVAL